MRLMNTAAALLLLTPGLLLADTTTVFPAAADSYDYTVYPYMFFQGDTVIGEREIPEDTVHAISYDISNDTQFLYCETQVDLLIDDVLIAELIHSPGSASAHFSGSDVEVDLTPGNFHTLQLIRRSGEMDDCGSVVVMEDVSTVTFHGTVLPDGVDVDGDGYDSLGSGGADCDDMDAQTNPGAEELCDGVDRDCDGSVDEGLTSTYYEDADDDNFGDASSAVSACELPEGYSQVAGDCDDGDELVNPMAADTCNGIDDNCNGQVDENGDDRFFPDDDGDGYGTNSGSIEACEQPAGYSTISGDCDDLDDEINPAAEEICDGIDNNCSLVVDEGTKTTYYLDEDRDGYGDDDTAISACEAPSGYIEEGGDCDDSTGAIHPGASELCDGLDNDCDGRVDNRDVDGDGYVSVACEGLDCDDSRADVNPGADELPGDGVDNDCDDEVDEETGSGCSSVGSSTVETNQSAQALMGFSVLVLGLGLRRRRLL